MKKRGILFLIMMLVLCVGGCGKSGGNEATETQWEGADKESISETADGGQNAQGPDSGDAGKAENGTEKSGDGSGISALSVEGIIREQSFEVELDGWGKVFFVSIAPEDGRRTPKFVLIKDKETVYTFPETEESSGDEFLAVSAVAFQDYNEDGKKDVIVLVSCGNGADEWIEPRVFLQENSDNMFYLDHPELESYRVEGLSSDGPAFYRDTFLEEYLSTQRLTDSVAALSGSWTDYVDYADSLLGLYSAEEQIRIFAEKRAVWTEGMDYANERFCFTIGGLCNDGRPVLIVSNQGGTGIYTYSRFYKIDKEGELQELETSFEEGDSQPDIMEENMTVYSSFSPSGIINHFIVYDTLKESPGTYLYRVSSLSISNDFVLETPLASRRIVYEGEDYSAHTTSEDCYGNALTEEEYDNFPDTYYGNLGLTKMAAVFKWIDVSTLEGMSDEEAQEALRQVYEGFSMG